MLAAPVLPRPLLSTYNNYLNLRSTGRGVLVSGLCQFPYLLLFPTHHTTYTATRFARFSFADFQGGMNSAKNFLDTHP